MNKCKLFPYFLIFITLLSSCNNTNSKKESELNLEKDTKKQSEKISEENQEVKTLFFEQQVGLNENQTSIYKLIFKDNRVEIVYKYLDYEEMKPEYAELVNGKIIVPENSLFFEGQKRDEVYKLNGNELCVFNAETDGFNCYRFIRSKSTHDIEEAINPELPGYFKGQPLKADEKLIKIRWKKEFTSYLVIDQTHSTKGSRYSSQLYNVPEGKKWVLLYLSEDFKYDGGSVITTVPYLYVDSKLEDDSQKKKYYNKNEINLSKAKDENLKFYSRSTIKAISTRANNNGFPEGDFVDYSGEMWFLEVNE